MEKYFSKTKEKQKVFLTKFRLKDVWNRKKERSIYAKADLDLNNEQRKRKRK